MDFSQFAGFDGYRMSDNRWKAAITRVVLQRRALFRMRASGATSSGEQLPAKARIMEEDVSFEIKSLSNSLKKIQVKIDPLAIEKVEDYLSYTPALRSLQDIQKIDKILSGAMPSFGKFTSNQRSQLLLSAYIEFHEKGTVIVREGREPLYFYLVLSGQCNVLKERSGVRQTINILNSGDSFTDLSKNGFLTSQRFATVQCAIDSTLLRVEKGKKPEKEGGGRKSLNFD